MKKLFGMKLSGFVWLLCGMILLSMMLAGCTGKSAKSSDAGYYVLDSASMEGAELKKEELEGLGMAYYIVFNDDGKGIANFDEPTEIEWGDGKFSADGETIEYTVEGDILTIEIEEYTIKFKRSNETPPSA